MKDPEIPQSTYRLQFNREFTFSDAIQAIPYLEELGISHCYASPYLRARPGSLHGYDIVDHRQINPEIGTGEEYERFVALLDEHGLGQILDIVPNHMGIMGSDNAWWLDVLENGEASAYADFFDIDWYPLKGELQGKVLVPVLGDQYGTVLDRGELRLTFDQAAGEFSICYFHHRFPIDPREYPRILGKKLGELEDRLGTKNADVLELQSLITAFEHLPSKEESSPEKRAERVRDKEIHKRRLASLCSRSPAVSDFLERVVEKTNGFPGDTSSFDQLHELIKKQAFRLAYWRVAADDINYRRFFDVNDLAALRQEDERVFHETHEFILRLLHAGKIDGLRIDHPDGLYDPQQYFARLQHAGNHSQHHYIVAEKILTGDEGIPENWPIDGTTGYNFLNLVNGLFVESVNEKKMNWIYRRFIGANVSFEELVYQSKKLVMDAYLNSELNLLANDLSRIALAERHTCDFTLKSLRDALTEIVALFPVYRTYGNEQLSSSDRAYIHQAVDRAIASNSAAEVSVYEFIRELLLRERQESRPKHYQRAVVRFAVRFQQYTSALMAKGLEDTSFYRYNCLVSLNEVGGDPLRFGVREEEFHLEMAKRAENWPHEMSATSTHDTKRSEDVRARIDVLSEMPLVWHRHVRRWRQLNRDKKTRLAAGDAPNANDEYLLYQTLVGAWPFEEPDLPDETFVRRISEYMRKAMREAKTHTNWANPNQAYESAVLGFVEAVLKSRDFCESFVPFQKDTAYFGMLNSLSQTLIKLTAPGVPDIYQGTELWDFSLVDPDNRRPVDYKQRLAVLRELKKRSPADAECAQKQLCSITQNMEDGRIKLHTIASTLSLRKQLPELFRDGEYLPLAVIGEKSRHVVAFARRLGDHWLIVAVPRLCAELLEYQRHLPCGSEIWRETKVELPEAAPVRFHNPLTGDPVECNPLRSFPASELFGKFPLALLVTSS